MEILPLGVDNYLILGGSISEERTLEMRFSLRLDGENSMLTKNDDIITHYIQLWGRPTYEYTFTYEMNLDSSHTPHPIFIFDFQPRSNRDYWVYATIGASSFTSNSREATVLHLSSSRRMELFMLSNTQHTDLVHYLGTLATYPVRENTFFAEGHTLHSNTGVVQNSPLTDTLITRADFGGIADHIVHNDGSHTHLLWAIPIYRAERMFAINHGWQSLQERFEQKDIDVLDVFRSSVV